ncbi:GntR family transcriptional regulator [Cereibacter azotoformans]|uniref:GntR family transcriptional regulator n=2 Tax=Cereibacter TaxID=1653176 RepID=A0A2T5K5N4_9RHOB|nr:GntR family transcriptional regulator [Cereibacter azotoformans]AXQ95538.1 GntR family transcriptional regulator [Cereibacter sphaeroides]PTR17723.1 GntR family transcriptional regulator [Cereibacter azotoformans]UIJ32216.1 GntR family transcriptional regulator [Cereibacter azotoformans]
MADVTVDRRTDQIREALEEMIVEGHFADGARLDEVSLADRFKVSRTPLREAFQALAASGLVELRHRRGAFVRYPALEDVVEMFDVMAEIEALCGRYAARRMSPEDQAAIEAALLACEAAAERQEIEAYYRANHDFHHLIYRASGNRFLAGEADRLHRRLKPFRRLQLRVRGRMAESLRQHRAIFAALVAGDAEGVTAVMREHIAVQGDRFNDLAANYRSATRGRRVA